MDPDQPITIEKLALDQIKTYFKKKVEKIYKFGFKEEFKILFYSSIPLVLKKYFLILKNKIILN